MAKLGEKLFNWFDERYNIRGFIEFMSHKSVPQHRHSIWYYFGGVSLFLFIIQVF
jgi:cytochrome b6